MTESTLNPHGENLRKAMTWLSQQKTINRDTIEKASIMYDLTPLEEEFLIRQFIKE